MKKSKLRKISEATRQPSVAGVISLLLKDHRAMRKLISAIKSPRSSKDKIVRLFEKLEKLVRSHVTSEERALLRVTLENPKFEGESREGIEEHRIHETILAGIRRVSSLERKVTRMHIFCEILEQHLDEEQEDLFPKFKHYAALSTQKKMGNKFLKTRVSTSRSGEKLGALSQE